MMFYQRWPNFMNNDVLAKKQKATKTLCRDPGLFRTHASSPDLNQGPSDLQSDALPTELSRQLVVRRPLQKVFYHGNNSFLKILNRSLVAQLIIDKLSIKLNYPVFRPPARNLRKRGKSCDRRILQIEFNFCIIYQTLWS